jgi:hypothetical protein
MEWVGCLVVALWGSALIAAAINPDLPILRSIWGTRAFTHDVGPARIGVLLVRLLSATARDIPTYSLSEQEAYLALDLFLAQLAARGSVDTSLAASWVHTEEHGEGHDPAMWADWLDCVRAALGLPLAATGDTFRALGEPVVRPSDFRER